VQFGSVFSEPIITDILRQEGITTHRCNYARLYLNDKDYGVYVNVERIDESFIERHLPDAKGLLFKVDQGGPGADLKYLGDDPAAYARGVYAGDQIGEDGGAAVGGVIRMIKQAPAAEFAAKLEREAGDRRVSADATAILLFFGGVRSTHGLESAPISISITMGNRADSACYLPWDHGCRICVDKRLWENQGAGGVERGVAGGGGSGPTPLMERIVADPEFAEAISRGGKDHLGEVLRAGTPLRGDRREVQVDRGGFKDRSFPHRRITNPGDRDYGDNRRVDETFRSRAICQCAAAAREPGRARRRDADGGGGRSSLGEDPADHARRAADAAERARAWAPIQRVMQQVGPLLQAGADGGGGEADRSGRCNSLVRMGTVDAASEADIPRRWTCGV